MEELGTSAEFSESLNNIRIAVFSRVPKVITNVMRASPPTAFDYLSEPQSLTFVMPFDLSRRFDEEFAVLPESNESRFVTERSAQFGMTSFDQLNFGTLWFIFLHRSW